MKLKSSKIFSGIVFFLCSTLLVVSYYLKNIYGGSDFEQIFYNIIYSEGVSTAPILEALKYCWFRIILLFLLVYVPFFLKRVLYLNFKMTKFNKKYSMKIFPGFMYVTIVVFLLVVKSLNNVGLFDYMQNLRLETNIYESYYVNPNNVELIFPKNKQNLIYIYLESMETSYSNYNINNKNSNVIPKLTALAHDQNNVYFSDEEGFGGFRQLSVATYTVASMVAQTSGVPLRTMGTVNSYGEEGNFLPGVVSLGDILADNGYNQYFLLGSNASFAGRDKYFTEHGAYNILDYSWAQKSGYIEEDYYVWWGYEDKKLFEFAKEQLKEISNSDEPFNFTILTADTHANDGYLDSGCLKKYDDVYANVLKCNDAMVVDFVNWVMKQDFADDTTIIITGDHLTMRLEASDFLPNNRSIYNVFINSLVDTSNTSRRICTGMDMFPTTLASIGVSIEGETLGLGVNLFSDKPTLVEELGFDYVDSELQKSSTYYNRHFLQGSYLELLSESE